MSEVPNPLIPKIENARIFDPVRRKWFVHTPEEYVRQSLILFLLHVKHYPRALVSVEKEITYNGLKKRYDIVVFSPQDTRPFLLAECKAPNIPIAHNEALHAQIRSYQIVCGARFQILTNGRETIYYERTPTGLLDVPDIPDFAQVRNA